jgi:hypothetical protein
VPDLAGSGGTPARYLVDGIARLAGHCRDAPSLPPSWSVDFSAGPELILRGGEQVDIVTTVNVPVTLPAPRPINVNAFADGVLAGGVTLYAHN